MLEGACGGAKCAAAAGRSGIGAEGSALAVQQPAQSTQAAAAAWSEAWSVVPADEWRQMLREAWRLQRDQFWTSDMSRVDWRNALDRYLLGPVARGWDWPTCGRLASTMGAIKIASRGPQNHKPTREEIQAIYSQALVNEVLSEEKRLNG